jgi:hypothetical protein
MNAFEIRLSLLNMAKEMLEADYHAERERIGSDYAAKVNTACAIGEDPPSHPGFPKFPGEDEIIRKARALNEFVSG